MITSGQPALNPRLVKEADALTESGHEVTVIYAYWNQWGKIFNEKLLAEKSWTALCAGGDPEVNKVTYLLSKVIFKLSKLVFQLSGRRWLAHWAIGRSGPFLTRLATAQAADLYIGHNLAALPATVVAAKKQKRPCGFDAEDLHRYEISSDPSHSDVILKSYIENKYLPDVQYLTVSSEPIGVVYQKLFPNLLQEVVHNVFPKSNIQSHSLLLHSEPIKLFWFSQTLGNRRGLQDIVGALTQLPRQDYELHLLCDQPAYSLSFKNELILSGINIRFYDPIPHDQLVTFAAQFDIGLAIEPGFSINNNLALSNKLFTYLQAGLFVIASTTTAQKAFLEQYSDIGLLYNPGDLLSLIKILNLLKNNRKAIHSGQRASLALAHKQMNWETEKNIFLTILNQAIKT